MRWKSVYYIYDRNHPKKIFSSKKKKKKSNNNTPIRIFARVALRPNGLRFSRFRFGGHKICTYWLEPILMFSLHRVERGRERDRKRNKNMAKEKRSALILMLISCSLPHSLNKPHTFRLRIIANKSCDDFQLEFMVRGRFLSVGPGKKNIVAVDPIHISLFRLLFAIQCHQSNLFAWKLLHLRENGELMHEYIGGGIIRRKDNMVVAIAICLESHTQ